MRAGLLALLLAAGCGTQIDFPSGGGTWPALEVPTWVKGARFAVTDNLSDTLSFVSADASKPQRFGAIDVGNYPVQLEGPHHVAASKDGRYLYVNLSNFVSSGGSGPHGSHGNGSVPGSLLKLDAKTGAKLAEVQVRPNPGDVILSDDNSLAFVSHYDLLALNNWLKSPTPNEKDAWATVAVVDTATMKVLNSLTSEDQKICVTPHGEGLSPDQRTLYVVCAESDELVALDVSNPSAPTVKNRVKVGPSPGTLSSPSYAPYALAVSPKDGSVWVSDLQSHDVRVYDASKGSMDPARTVLLGGSAMFGAFTKLGDRLYVAHQGDDRVTRIDTSDVTKTTDLVLPQGDTGCVNAHAFVLAPDEQSAVVVCEGNHVTPGSVVFVTVPAFAATGAVNVGVFPDGAAWLPPAP